MHCIMTLFHAIIGLLVCVLYLVPHHHHPYIPSTLSIVLTTYMAYIPHTLFVPISSCEIFRKCGAGNCMHSFGCGYNGTCCGI